MKRFITQHHIGYWLMAGVLSVTLIPVLVYAYNRALGIGVWMTGGDGYELRSYRLEPLDPATVEGLEWTDGSRESPNGRWRAALQEGHVVVTEIDSSRFLTDMSPVASAPYIDRIAWIDNDTIAIKQRGIRDNNLEQSYVMWKWHHGQALDNSEDDFRLKAFTLFVVLTPSLLMVLRATVTAAKKLGARLNLTKGHQPVILESNINLDE